jgi:NAD(P) transhydrogenase
MEPATVGRCQADARPWHGGDVREESFDVVVIGSGPGGEGAAMKAAKSGLSVAVVERFVAVGGGCTHWGTIPSKALRHAIRTVGQIRDNPIFEGNRPRLPELPELLASAERVIRKQVDLRAGFYERNRVPVFEGQASFVDPHTLAVTADGIEIARLKARFVVIATGSRPYRPKGVDFAHPRILDADKVLQLDFSPKSITIYGAGVIGSEYASMFRSLGIKVTLINTRDKLLAFLDDEIIDALAYHLRNQGVVIKHNEEMESIQGLADGAGLALKSGKRIKSDVLLFAQGRTGNTDGLNVEAAGITPNKRGQLEVDRDYRTAVPHIYAVGDVIGWPSLASAAYDQGRFAASRLADGECPYSLVEHIPTGIYTSPEISSVGKTEKELTEAKVPYEVGHAMFRHLARAQISGDTVGMLKLLFHRETLEVLGIHCFGTNASEIVHIGQAIMAQEGEANSIQYFANTTFNYPTMAEAYRVAALNGLNRLF